jgi:hypothetical protein
VSQQTNTTKSQTRVAADNTPIAPGPAINNTSVAGGSDYQEHLGHGSPTGIPWGGFGGQVVVLQPVSGAVFVSCDFASWPALGALNPEDRAKKVITRGGGSV